MTLAIYETILFCLNFHKHILIIEQEQTSLLNHCLSTQGRPHVRPRPMLRAPLSFANNNPFYHKQSLLPIHNRLLLENNNLLLENNRMEEHNDRSAHPTLLRTGFRRTKNLKDLLVLSTLSDLNRVDTLNSDVVGCFRCNHKVCNACHNFYSHQTGSKV